MTHNRVTEGDVWVRHTDDGGEIHCEQGIVSLSHTFNTAVYYSWFGGNQEDDGTASNRLQYWGNLIEKDPARHMRSRVQHLLLSIAAVPANLRRVEVAGRDDLAWMLTGNPSIASEIEVRASIPRLNWLKLEADIVADSRTTGRRHVSHVAFEVIWRHQMNKRTVV